MVSLSTTWPSLTGALGSPLFSRDAGETVIFVGVVAGSAVCIGPGEALGGGMCHDDGIIGIRSLLGDWICFCVSSAETCSTPNLCSSSIP